MAVLLTVYKHTLSKLNPWPIAYFLALIVLKQDFN